MTNKIAITKAGYAGLEEELHHLKYSERPNIIKAISEARAHGDLSENAEYSSAKEKQGMIEAKIKDLEARISAADIVDVSVINSDKVQFGATVTVEDEDTSKKMQYQIVGDYEASLEDGKISIASPIAKALIGKKQSDSVEVNVPSGIKYYHIEKIEYK